MYLEQLCPKANQSHEYLDTAEGENVMCWIKDEHTFDSQNMTTGIHQAEEGVYVA